MGTAALSSNISGNYNTALGYNTNVSQGNFNNTTVIGAQSTATASNQVRLGNENITSLFCKGAWAATTTNPSNLYVDPNGQIMRSTADNDHSRLHTMTSASDHAANSWRMFYSDGTERVKEMPLGNAGHMLQSNGPAALLPFLASGYASFRRKPESAGYNVIPQLPVSCRPDGTLICLGRLSTSDLRHWLLSNLPSGVIFPFPILSCTFPIFWRIPTCVGICWPLSRHSHASGNLLASSPPSFPQRREPASLKKIHFQPGIFFKKPD